MKSVSPISRLNALRVRDVMNRNIVKLSAHQSMTEVAKAFLDHEISAAPVADEFDCCIGILSATDFLRRDGAADEMVSSYMTQSVRTIDPNALLLKAAIMMNAQHIHRLPVVDENNRVVGMISTMDVVAAVMNSFDEMEMVTH